MTAKRIALALVLSLTAVLVGAAGASAAVDVNLTVSGTGGVLVQVPHMISGTIVGYTTEDACSVDPAHPLKQGEKINCSFPNVPTYTCGASQCLIFTASAPPGWGFAGWEPCGFACQIVFPSPCAGTNTSPCTFVTDGESAAYDTGDFTDTRPPDVTIVSGPPEGHVAISTTSSEAFAFANTNEPAESPTFLCSLDGGVFADCPSTYRLQAISDGIHTLAVEAKDASGLIGPAVRRRWEQETPPTADIVSGPAQGSTIGTPSAQFGFGSSKPAATVAYRCSLDGAPFQACPNPVTYTGLGIGAHTLDLKATFTAPIDGTVTETGVTHRAWSVLSSIPSIGTRVAMFWSYRTRAPFFTRVSSAVVGPVPAGSTVTLRCSRRGCPFRQKTVAAPQAKRRIALTKLFKHRKLRPGAKVTVEVTKPATIGVESIVRIRRSAPKRTDLCVPPNGKPAPC